MKHAKLLEAKISAKHCYSETVLHDYLKHKLHFPDHYGANLSALADCLSEMGMPTLITIDVDEDKIEPGMQAYLLRFVQVVAREAFVNPKVSLIIQH